MLLIIQLKRRDRNPPPRIRHDSAPRSFVTANRYALLTSPEALEAPETPKAPDASELYVRNFKSSDRLRWLVLDEMSTNVTVSHLG